MYPKGRMVKYEASNWIDIPTVGNADADDHLDSAEEVANPLTVLQNDSKDWTRPEIPIKLWRGTPNGIGKELLPTDKELFEQDLEINVTSSRAITASIKSATGITAITTEVGGSPVLPDQIAEGISKLGQGQSIDIMYVPGSNAKDLMDNNERVIAYTSEAKGVPAYKVSINQTIVPSGAALIQLNKVETQTRMQRADINRHEEQRGFEIEMALAAIQNDDQDYGKGITQIWTVNADGIVKTDLEIIEELERDKALGVIDNRGIARVRVAELAEADNDTIDEYLGELIPVATEPELPAIARVGLGNATVTTS
jgi:hypothetical protein